MPLACFSGLLEVLLDYKEGENRKEQDSRPFRSMMPVNQITTNPMEPQGTLLVICAVNPQMTKWEAVNNQKVSTRDEPGYTRYL